MKKTSKKIAQTICRLCLCKVEDIDMNLNQKDRKTFREMNEMLQEIFRIDVGLDVVSSTEAESHTVCVLCEEKLLSSYDFYQTIHRSLEILKHQKVAAIDEEEQEDQKNFNDTLDMSSSLSDIKIEESETNDIEYQILDSAFTDNSEELILKRTRKTKQKKTENLDKTKKIKPKDKSTSKESTVKKSTINVVSKQEKAEEDQRIREFFSLVCTTCTESFENFGFYRSHMIEKHKIERPAIMCCKKRFTKRCRLLEHLIFHVNPEEYQCSSCGRQCLNKFRLEQHRLQHHSSLESRKHQCTTCKKRFLIPANLKAHMLTHLSQEEKDRLKTYTCDQCGNSYSSKYLIEQHIRKIHLKVYAFVCDICAKPFKTKNDFLYHYSHIHATIKEPKVQCNICLVWLTNDRCLKTHHRRIHANPGPHICNVCGKEAPTSEALRSHQRYVHEAQRKFQCTYCDKAFKKEVILKEHMTTHLGGVLYTCCFCDKTFNSGANMYSHRKKKHPAENEKLVQESRKEKFGPNPTDS